MLRSVIDSVDDDKGGKSGDDAKADEDFEADRDGLGEEGQGLDLGNVDKMVRR